MNGHNRCGYSVNGVVIPDICTPWAAFLAENLELISECSIMCKHAFLLRLKVTDSTAMLPVKNKL